MKIISPLLIVTLLTTCIQEGYAKALHENHDLQNHFISGSILKTPTGTDDFKSFIEERNRFPGRTFVDKSLLIAEILTSTDRNILITRPRRWGKSLNLSMLRYFFGREVDKTGNPLDGDLNPHRELFKGMKIAHQTTSVESKTTGDTSAVNFLEYFQGHYPVIFLSMKDIKRENYAEVKHAMTLQIIALFAHHKYLPSISSWEKEIGFGELTKDETKFNDKVKERIENSIGLERALETLSKWLYEYHGRKPYVLIDEYDAAPNYLLFKEGAKKEDILPVAELISNMLSPLCKTTELTEKVILTGVFDTLYREAGSGINNVKPYSILKPQYADHYGFSEQEIRQQFLPNLILGDQNTLIDQLKTWYNGYTDKGLYAPWPVVLHLSDVIHSCQTQCNYSLKPENYWNHSGASDALTKIANIFKTLNASSQKQIDITTFLFTKHPSGEMKPSSISTIFEPNQNKADVLRYMLIHFGYLTVKNQEISIPNEEVKTLYKEHFEYWTQASPPDEIKTFVSFILQSYLNQQNTNLLSVKMPSLEPLIHMVSQRPFAGSDGLIQQLKELPKALRIHEIVQGILRDDLQSLASLIRKGETCAFPSLPFNVFHLAAMAGNPEVWEWLQSKCEDALSLVKQPDQALGVLPGGYVVLGDHMSLKKFANRENLLYQPGAMEKVFCAYVPISVSVLLAGTTAKTLSAFIEWIYALRLTATATAPSKTLTDRLSTVWSIPSVSSTLIGGTLGAYYNNMINSWFADICANTHTYTAIDASPPGGFQTLSQLEKYIVDYPNAYMALGDRCRSEDKRVGEVTQPLIQSEGQYKKMPFSLCHYNKDQSRQLALASTTPSEETAGLYAGFFAISSVCFGLVAAIGYQLFKRCIATRRGVIP